MKLSLLNTVNSGVSTAQLNQIAYALRRQFQDYAQVADIRTPVIYIGQAAGAFPITFFKNADVAQALGYHDTDSRGNPYGKVFTDVILQNGGSVLGDKGDPAFSVSACASHEVGETLVDPTCYWWWDNGHISIAAEDADPVQGDAYTINGVAVSNLIIPQAWANPKAPRSARFDMMEKLTAPFTRTPGGYWVQMDDSGSETTFADGTTGEKEVFKLLVDTKARFAGSRTAKRMAALPDDGAPLAA